MLVANILHCLAATAVLAHFVLDIPTSIGFDDEKLDQGPCGSFDPTDRSKGVTKWSVEGGNIGVLSTHGQVTWEINAALVSEPTKFLPLVQQFAQTGVGNVCIQRVPGFSAWIGQPVVLQVIQHGHDGVLHQCAAIEFVVGSPDPAPSGCTNSNGVKMDPLVPAPAPAAPAPPAPLTSSSSAASTGGSSTTTRSQAGPPVSSASGGATSGVPAASARPSHHGGSGDGHEGHGASSRSTSAAVPTNTTSRPVIIAAANTVAKVQEVVLGAMVVLATTLLFV